MDRQRLSRDIELFLAEDIGLGDITTQAIFSREQVGMAEFIAKESFVAAGIDEIVPMVFQTRNPAVDCHAMVKDGSRVAVGDKIFSATGPVVDLLTAERVALNLAQRLSGIATLTAAFVEKIAGFTAKIVDTRKTTPGLRALEKYAVRIGGGHNHRFNLADGVLIKDNHIAACGSIQKAVDKARFAVPHTIKIEVETENLAQVEECLAARVEIIMLDNMTPALMAQAVKLIGGRALVEASGGVNLDNVHEIAATGVDLISVGALTHSAKAVDISMRLKVGS
ncbi:MAG: carboxylating nicotinate-nucleotide diphosphorylase [Desulfobulbaceae bacterium]|nr:carboxylating nicotinate-nucleotide diphosphorylase [Desulfobulbaceae bacterium]HIJ79807.1 carboxylating nicotinate-nucleotide diphosphorylase [Deltaproteobacteria bacterium]